MATATTEIYTLSLHDALPICSVRGMDFMVRHMHQQAGLDLPAAVRMATLTPATIVGLQHEIGSPDRKSTRLNSSHGYISYAVFCLKKKNTFTNRDNAIRLHGV